MPIEKTFEFVAVDEIQLCSDSERGHIFTDRLINARGQFETLFGIHNCRASNKNHNTRYRKVGRDRLSKLSYSGKKIFLNWVLDQQL